MEANCRLYVLASVCLKYTHKFFLALIRPVYQSNRRKRSHTGRNYDYCVVTTLIGSFKNHNRTEKFHNEKNKSS